VKKLIVATAALALALAACGGSTVTATLTVIPGDTPTTASTPTASLSPSPSPTVPPTASPTSQPGGCGGLPGSPGAIGQPSPGCTVTPEPTVTLPPATNPPPSPSPVAVATPWPGCINGWTRPVEGETRWVSGLEILTGYLGLADPLIVDDMVYFVGPDPDNILEPRYERVKRWYIKGWLKSDATYRGRWLIEKRTDTVLGVSAVAPYDTTGYESPDWSGFVGDGVPRAIDGLPGEWGGIQYDFVTGEGDSGFPGLPVSQAECLAGT
jgi:hypothetical protein